MKEGFYGLYQFSNICAYVSITQKTIFLIEKLVNPQGGLLAGYLLLLFNTCGIIDCCLGWILHYFRKDLWT